VVVIVVVAVWSSLSRNVVDQHDLREQARVHTCITTRGLHGYGSGGGPAAYWDEVCGGPAGSGSA